VPNPTPSPTATEKPIGTYIVQSEYETIECLTRRFDRDLNTLLALNLLDANAKLKVEMEILLSTGPFYKGERTLKPHPATYTVLSGDTVYDIACSFGDISPERIMFENRLTDPLNLTVGQQLSIP
jgi:LysM repeat protein